MNKLGCLILMILAQQVIAQGTWTQKANVFTTRAGAVGFSISNKGYLCSGWQWSNSLYYNDLWEWDQITNAWSQKANFPDTARGDGAGFSIGSKGYILTGNILGGLATNAFWEWDQATNTWSQKAFFPGLTRAFAITFSIGLKGYIGCGENLGMLNDFWEYNQQTDIWTQMSNIPIGRSHCTAFSIGNMGYVCCGQYNFLPSYLNDLWEFDSGFNTWTQKANFPGGNRGFTSGFSIGNKGYVGTGWDGANPHSDFWCYNPSSNLWTQKANYPHAVTDIDKAGFAIGCKGYFGTGATSPTGSSVTYYNDFWEYEPDTCNLTGISVNKNNEITLTIIPNPFSEKINISVNNYYRSEIIVYNSEAKEVLHKNFINTISLNTKSLAKGIYLYEVRNKNGVIKKGKVVKD